MVTLSRSLLIFSLTFLIVMNWTVGEGFETFGADIPWRSEHFFSRFEVMSSNFGLNELMAPHYARIFMTSVFQLIHFFFSTQFSTIIFNATIISIFWMISSSIIKTFFQHFECEEKILSLVLGFLFTFGPVGFFYFIRLQNNFFFPLAVLASYSIIFHIYKDKSVSRFEKIRWVFICLLNFPLSYQAPLLIAGVIALSPFYLVLSFEKIKRLCLYSSCLFFIGMPGILISYFFGIKDGASEFSSFSLINWVSQSSSIGFVLGNIADIGWHENYFVSWHFLTQTSLYLLPSTCTVLIIISLLFISNFSSLGWRIFISTVISIFGSTGTYYSDIYLFISEYTALWAVRAPWQKFHVYSECWYIVILCGIIAIFKKEQTNDFSNWIRWFNRKLGS